MINECSPVSAEVDRLKRNIYSKYSNNDEFYNANKIKGDLVITDHALLQRNKIFPINEEIKPENENVNKIFDTFRDCYNEEQERLTERSFKFPLSQYIMYLLKSLCCKSKMTEKEQHYFKLFEYASKFVNHTLDITNYIHLQSTIARLKILTLPGNHQSLAFDMFKKPNLFNKDELA